MTIIIPLKKSFPDPILLLLIRLNTELKREKGIL